MNPISRLWSGTFLVVSAAVGVVTGMPARADVIVDWNVKADELAVEQRTPPVNHARWLAILHVAMFEAVNAVQPKYTAYKLTLKSDPKASREAAAASAGHDVLAAEYPSLKPQLDAALTAMLGGVPDGVAKSDGIEVGRTAAASIIALRANDGITARETYRPQTTPGVYVPAVIPVSSTIGAVTPWVMTSASQFRPGPPPALTSEIWTKDINEIRELGSRDSTTRTAEQTTIARFWFAVGPLTYNPIVRQIAVAKHMDLLDCARLFALVSMAGFDAQVAVFDAKYTYNLWRPMTAIRNADQTGNSATPRDSAWLPLGDTPMHPEYPCAHCIVSAAVVSTIQGVVGDDVGELSMTSATAPGVTRKWTRLRDYTDEISSARIYAGFHYRNSTVVGQEMGRKIGELATSAYLRLMLASRAGSR
jgi:VCPO second helical-bundle domain